MKSIFHLRVNWIPLLLRGRNLPITTHEI